MLAVRQIAFAGDELTVESKTSVQNLNHPIKLKVIASANGDTKAKILNKPPIPLISRGWK
jgi:hypothetical protein